MHLPGQILKGIFHIILICENRDRIEIQKQKTIVKPIAKVIMLKIAKGWLTIAAKLLNFPGLIKILNIIYFLKQCEYK